MLLLKTENLISIRGKERQEEQRPGGCLCLLNMNQSSWRQKRAGTLIWNHVPSPDRCCLMAVVLRTLMTAASLLGCLATVVGGVVVPLSCQLIPQEFSQYSEKAPTEKLFTKGWFC